MLSSILFGSPIVTGLTGASCILSAYLFYYLHQRQQLSPATTPISVNYHFSRKCNYTCGFCFHTEQTSSILSLDDAKRGMKLLKEAGMKKLNFAGGEPFLYPSFMRELLRYGKGEESCRLVSTVRHQVQNQHRCMCLNWDENMIGPITQFQPFRWKVFQCLIVTGENDNEQRKRDARSYLVSDEQWTTFCDRHKQLNCFVPESNEVMKGSYLILDEYMRFLDKGDGEEKASESILTVGVRRAMAQVRWEHNAFLKRGGFYDWTKTSEAECTSSGSKAKELEW